MQEYDQQKLQQQPNKMWMSVQIQDFIILLSNITVQNINIMNQYRLQNSHTESENGQLLRNCFRCRDDIRNSVIYMTTRMDITTFLIVGWLTPWHAADVNRGCDSRYKITGVTGFHDADTKIWLLK
jgi:hypothetical protein